LHEERQPDPLIPDGRQKKDRTFTDLDCTVGNRGQLPPLQEGAQMRTPTSCAQPDCPNDAQPAPPTPLNTQHLANL
jgi:hypothetical protein